MEPGLETVRLWYHDSYGCITQEGWSEKCGEMYEVWFTECVAGWVPEMWMEGHFATEAQEREGREQVEAIVTLDGHPELVPQTLLQEYLLACKRPAKKEKKTKKGKGRGKGKHDGKGKGKNKGQGKGKGGGARSATSMSTM